MNSPISFPIGLPGQWHAAQGMSIPDAYLKNWLLDTGSLTERLQSHCRQFSLTLLGQQPIDIRGFAPPVLDSEGSGGWQVREVILRGNGEPWVFAHSLIPDSLCEGDLAGIGNKPLGQRIFNDPRFARSAFELTRLAAEAPLLQQLHIPVKHALWGRRSVFTMADSNMLVAEIFLPAAPAYAHMQVN